MNKILTALVISVLSFATAARAEETLQDQLVYRTNLGRAADVNLLINNGGSPNQTNEDGVPLLALASARRDSEGLAVVKTLLSDGADINATDHQGQTALFYAVRQGNLTVVNYLLANNIDYNAVDHHGDIARTVAHDYGHDDIVAAIDKFTTTQANQINQQYADAEKSLQNQYKQQQIANQKAAAELAQRQAELNAQIKAMKEQQEGQGSSNTMPPITPTPQITQPSDALPMLSQGAAATQAPLPSATLASNESPKNVPSTAVTPAGPTKEEIEAKKMLIEERRNSPQFQDDMRNFAFNSCAYQYWSYMQQVHQSSELSDDEIEIAIESHKDQIKLLTDHIDDIYGFNASYTGQISDKVKRRIFNQLDYMPSNTYRHEHNVGKMDDMKQRCDLISHNWERDPEPMPKPVDVGNGGGIGGVGKNKKSLLH